MQHSSISLFVFVCMLMWIREHKELNFKLTGWTVDLYILVYPTSGMFRFKVMDNQPLCLHMCTCMFV